MTRIELPALRSDDTLGFLAALGVLELLTSVCGLAVRLGWTGVGGAALVENELPGREAVAESLAGVARRMAADGRVVPVTDAGFIARPLPDGERKARKEVGLHVEYDPMRLLPEEAIERYARALEREEAGDAQTSRWLVALVNQLAFERNGPARALTPLYSPAGRMSLHQIYRDARDGVANEPEVLREALEGWRRREGTGANLDARALRDGAVTATGQASNRAVGGASWLALMAAPLFPQVGNASRRAAAVGWDLDSAGGPRLNWPIWRRPVDLAAVEALLSHPAVARALPEDRTRPLPEPKRGSHERARRAALRELQAIGVLAICVARRQPLAKSGGPLMPPAVTPV